MRIVALMALAFAFTTPAHANETASVVTERPIVAAMFSSRFCSACLIMNPRVNAVKADFQGRAVEFIKFDQTASLITGGRLDRLAEDKGVTAAWQDYRGGTGFLLLVDPADGRVLDRLTISSSADDIRARINLALRPPEA